MKRFFVLLTLIIALSSSALLAQQTYEWKYYGLEVTVPNDYKVVKNSNEEFEMKGQGMGMYMFIFEGDITAEEMDEAVAEAALSIDMQEVDAAHIIQGDGLDGFYVEGFKDGLRVMLAGMIDPNSQTNFMMLITFYDEDGVAESDAIDIINSVTSTK